MNTTPKDGQKEQVLKLLAVGGLVGLLVIIAWLGITLVRAMPNAFTSLASLADSVYNYQPVELIVVSSGEIVNSGDLFSLSWNDPKPAGSFSFTYGCTDGVAIDIKTESGTQSAECEVPFVLGDITSLTMSINAERNRFTDIPYTLSFITPRAIGDVATTDGVISVVNASIATPDATATTTPIVTPAPEAPKPTPAPVTTTEPIKPAASTSTKPVAVKPTTPKPTYIQTPIYGIPVSNPNGVTDLAIRSLGAGTISNSTFLNVGTISASTESAIQFEIKNIGTNTSQPFTYTAVLPNGTTYTSPTQTGLKPNERTIVTLGFSMDNARGIKPFSAAITTTGDTATLNNTFTSAVTVR